MILRALLLPVLPLPTPRIQDEFSHLLVADTLAHGRLANPAHPLWKHFESMHMLSKPVYASSYPAGPGALMALGQKLGHPWIGVWLGMGAMCAALCWMLQGWVPPSWALIGGLLAALRFGVFSYWMNSYLGGGLAAAGGALLLGGLGRLFRRRRWQDAAVMAAGLAILANSRPYEGLLLGAPAVLAVGVWVWRDTARAALLNVAIGILAVTAGGMAYYCNRITGSPLQLPYSFYRANFTMAPHFLFQSPRPEPVYLHRVLRRYHTGWEMGAYEYARANRAPYGIGDKAMNYWRFYFGPFLTVAFVAALPWLWKRRRTRYLLLAGVFFAAGLAVEVWHQPHYAAPATGVALLLVVEAMRHIRLWRWGRLLLIPVLIGGCVLSPTRQVAADTPGHGEARATVMRQLEALPGRQLAILRYTLGHDVGNEWVYNSADIDGAPVVWAREMDPASNRNLLRYFAGRQVWLVEPDAMPPRVSPYDPSAAPDPPFGYVKLGTEAIEVLRDPAEVRRKILTIAPQRGSCDQWNFWFYQATGVEGPAVDNGCYPPGDRGRQVSFEEWFAWLGRQR